MYILWGPQIAPSGYVRHKKKYIEYFARKIAK